MLAVRFTRCGAPAEVLELTDVPTPRPGQGEVLVEMQLAPINPSDRMFVSGSYGIQPELPATPGFEGIGRVIGAGPGLLGRLLLGRRVAVGCRTGGTWAQQVVAPAKSCIPLPGGISPQEGAVALVNPCTAFLLVRGTRRLGPGDVLIQTAAASHVGRMLVRLSQRFGFRVVSIVRRAAQVELLAAFGATDILCCTDMQLTSLQQLRHELRGRLGSQAASHVVDAVGGPLGSTLLSFLKPGGQFTSYGTLSDKPLDVSPRELIASDLRLDGFWLGTAMDRLSLLGKVRLIRQVTSLIQQGVLASGEFREFPLDQIADAIAASTAPESSRVLLQLPPS
ncbi:MAG: zinc-dependent alcohol dehydrogenase family protein [Planctomycetaceae bacterium]|nr:zinc-dependent alcohol dehydrogenase family protein [Planctomycetaceae bacterium]